MSFDGPVDFDGIVALAKFLHIAALAVWSAGLVALPLMLAQHRRDSRQIDYTRLRLVTHYAYTRVVTPAAVVAIAVGTALIFLRGVFVPWLFLKLVMVGAMVALHAYLGLTITMVGEKKGEVDTPSPLPLVSASLAAMVLVLVLVLAKPLFADAVVPAWLLQPLGKPLPVPETPI